MKLELIVGLMVSAVPLLIIGYLMLKRQPGIYRMFVAMVLVGLGYLTATGAMTDIGRSIIGTTLDTAGERSQAVAPVAQPARPEAPSQETKPAAEAPSEPAAESPAAEDASGEPPPAADLPETDAPPPPAEGESPQPAEPAPAQ